MGKRGKGTRSGDAALLRQGKQSKSSRSKAEDYFNDEIDDFHEEREKVLLDGKGLYDDDEDEDEVSNEQRNVLALENDGLDAHFDEYGYEESEEDDVGEEDNDAEHSDSDSSEVRRKARQERYEERITQNWGKQKKSYYHTDYVDEEHSLSDEEVAKEEEEVKRLEKKKQISKADFGVESDSEDDSASSSSSSQTSRKNKSKSKTTSDDDLALLRKVNESLDDVGFGDLLDTNVDVERVDRDLTHMSKKEKRKLIETDSPELLQLLDDFKEMIEELKERIEPTITKVRTGDLPTKGGISLLDVKFQLMLNYCTNVAFYLLLKAEGRRVTDHPVILQLVKTRTLLEKLRPLDKKLAYQINKMLKLSSAIGEGDDAVAEALANDPMSHRPRLEMFGDDTVKHTKTMDSRGAEPDESDDAQVQNGDAAYVPPRLSAVPYDGDAKSTSKRDYQRKRAANSRMAQFVVDEFGEEPEELRENAGGAYDAVGDDKTEADRLRYEEENFLRLMTNKKDRKKRKRNELKNELAALNEYADLGALDAIGDDFGSDDEAMLDDDDDTATKAAASHGQRRSLSQLINSLEQSSKKFAGAHRASGDDDVPYAAAQPEQIPLAKKQQKRARYQEDDDEDDGDAPIDYNDAAFDEDNDVYAEAKALERAQLKANKSSKEQKTARKAARAKAKLEAKEAELEALPEDYKRKTNSRIERNRGLVRSRPAYQANPRVAMRRKHQDKVRRRRGAVPKSRTEDGPYGGEASGVKTNIKRSVPLTR